MLRHVCLFVGLRRLDFKCQTFTHTYTHSLSLLSTLARTLIYIYSLGPYDPGSVKPSTRQSVNLHAKRELLFLELVLGGNINTDARIFFEAVLQSTLLGLRYSTGLTFTNVAWVRFK